MFTLTDNKIITDNEINKIDDLSVGGLVIFEGRVRNHNEGKEVRELEYEVYPEMAIKTGNEIVDIALSEFPVNSIKCIHRYGNLKLGDIAVLVIAASKHRKEAFRACEFVIDKVKDQVPIWKKEHYVEGPSEWVACHRCQGGHD